MKFARYWRNTEVPVDERLFGTSTVTVWGASNDSAGEAQRQAQSRAARFGELVAGGLERLREYEYWNGFIREEVVEEVRTGDGRVLAVLTRNSYGATVLNSESVLFGDIDIPEPGLIARLLRWLGAGQLDKAGYLARIERYQKANPAHTFRVYETCAGLRFVITSQAFEADSPAVKALFAALGVDPLYMRLCKQQTCFRARLTPKPWRIGLDRPDSRFPRDAHSEQRDFEGWLGRYARASAGVGVVRLLATFGAGRVHPDVKPVLAMHDRYANRGYGELA